jgi:hypothetical protein
MEAAVSSLSAVTATKLYLKLSKTYGATIVFFFLYFFFESNVHHIVDANYKYDFVLSMLLKVPSSA